jgi:hypothetical protein
MRAIGSIEIILSCSLLRRMVLKGLNSNISLQSKEENPDNRSPKEREPSDQSGSFSTIISRGDFLLKKYFRKSLFRKVLM